LTVDVEELLKDEISTSKLPLCRFSLFSENVTGGRRGFMPLFSVESIAESVETTGFMMAVELSEMLLPLLAPRAA